MKNVTAFFFALLLTACGAFSYDTVQDFYIAKDIKSTLLPPAVFAGEAKYIQSITAFYKDTQKTLTGIVSLSTEKMQVIALADMVRLLTITYDGASLAAEVSPLLPGNNIRPEYILADIQLIYFPLAALQGSLPQRMRLEDSPGQRVLYADGEKIVVISYTDKKIRFENLERLYAYEVTALEGVE